MATEVGNIHIGLYVDVGESRRFTDVANLIDRDTRRMNTALGNTTRSVGALRAGMSQNMRFRIASDSLRQLSRATGEMERLRAAMLAVSAITGTGITGAFTAAYLVQTADKARLLSNQIKTVTTDTAEYAAIQDQLFAVSQRTRTSLESTIQIYARTKRATESLGTSQEKVLRLTETVQKAFAIGGATPQEASGAAIQLSQGIASDRFSGEEFRSVAENAPVLLKGIADSLGVNIGKLREMAIAGELTAKVVTEAIIKSSDDIDAAFKLMVPTVAQSFTLLDNAFLRYTGNTDEAYGVTKNLSGVIMELADNLEDVMYWVTRAAAGLTAFYLARKLTLKGQDVVGGVRSNNAAIRQEISDRVEANKEIDGRLAEIRKAESDALATVGKAETDAMLKQSDAVNAARTKEFESEKKVRDLQAARTQIVGKLGAAQNAAVVNLQKEVEVARQRVRDDQLRVIQAQEAAAAEERILRARVAQKLSIADKTVEGARGKVFNTLDRVGQTEAAIKAERELAKVKLSNEIDARRQSLVTSQQRLSEVQRQIADVRTIRDLPDFEKVYGAQYRKLLTQQQKAIISSSKLRDEIGSLGKQMEEIDSGAAATRGISAAMNKHAMAVKQAEAAVKSLAAAEESRNKIAAAPVAGKTLQARVAAEAREIDRYQKSIDNLNKRMVDLREATAGAFSGNAARKMLTDIDVLDKKIVAAQTNLAAASAAVMAAQSGNGEALAASLAAQEKAAKQINALHSEAANLIERQVVNTSRLESAQKRLNVLRRVGSNVIGFFGGWTGLAITAALVTASALMSKFAMEAAESAEQTDKIRGHLEAMGYLTAAASDAMAGFKADVAEGRVAKLLAEVEDFTKEMEKSIDKLNALDFEGPALKTTSGMKLGSTEGMTDEQIAWAMEDMEKSAKSAKDEVKSALMVIRDEMVKNKSMSEEARKSLEDMALANPKLAAIALSLIKLGEYMNGLQKATDDWLKSVEKVRMEAGRTWGERFRSSENQSMTDLNRMNSANDGMIEKELRDAGLSDYESRIRQIRDKLIADAEKLGNILSPAIARAAAEKIYASDVAKKGLRDLIGLYEGTDKGRGYNETLGYGKFTGGDVNLTQMTLKEILELQKKMLAHPDNTFNSSAVGRYQITAQTLRDFMGRMNLSPDDVFTPELQDRLANEIIRSTGGSIDKLRGRWEGLQNASDKQIQTASLQTFTDLPRLDESSQQWLDGIKDLDLKAQIESLNEYDQKIVQTAQSMGVSREAVEQYIKAVTSGDMSKAPAVFEEINKRLQAGVDAGYARKMRELQQSGMVELLSEIDQKVIETARSFGFGEDAIKGYIDAARDGRLDEIPDKFKAIKDAIQEIDEIKATKDIVNGFFTDLRSAAEDGKITLEEFGDMAVNVANKIADRFQTMLVDQMFAGGGFNLFGLFGSGASTGGGIAGFDSGGPTGSGNDKDVAGVVHKNEYVFDAETTRKVGVQKLRLLHDFLKTGRMPQQTKMFGSYMNGGAVTKMRMPDYQPGATANDSGFRRQAEAMMANAQANAPQVKFEVHNHTPARVRTEESTDQNGGRRVKAIIEEEVGSAITRPGSAANRAAKNTFGVRNKLVKR